MKIILINISILFLLSSLFFTILVYAKNGDNTINKRRIISIDLDGVLDNYNGKYDKR